MVKGADGAGRANSPWRFDGRVQRDLFVGFLRSGLLGYGGGPSAIPLVHREVVHTYGWLTNEEFADVLALGNSLPGPIATKMAGYIGYRTGGYAGMATALIATVLPTVVGMIALVGTLSAFRDSPIVAGMTEAIAPVIAVMLAVMTWQFMSQSKRELGWVGSIGLAAASVVLFAALDIHPALVILVLLAAALGWEPLRRRLRGAGADGGAAPGGAKAELAASREAEAAAVSPSEQAVSGSRGEAGTAGNGDDGKAEQPSGKSKGEAGSADADGSDR